MNHYDLSAYADLAEHFGTVLLFLGIFASGAWYFFWRFFTRMEKSVDSLSAKFEAFLSNVVTKHECEQKHESLITIVQALLNCRTCGKEKKGE